MIPATTTVLLRGATWLGEAALPRLMALVTHSHPTRPPRAPLYYLLHPTILVWQPQGRDLIGAERVVDPQLIGYTSLSLTPSLLVLQDTGIHADHRRRGLGAACLAERMRLGLLNGCKLAVGGVEVGNDAAETMLRVAGYEIHPGHIGQGPRPATAVLADTMGWLEGQYEKNPWLAVEAPEL